MPTLYIICGPSGSGKSTWAKNYMIEHDEQDIRYVSRDEIRYSIVHDDEPYFSHEREVFRKFVSTIVNTLIDGFDVIADATHLNSASRAKLTNAIDARYSDYDIIYVVFNVHISECIRRNGLREGRMCVPDGVIDRQFHDFYAPTLEEDVRATRIIYVY